MAICANGHWQTPDWLAEALLGDLKRALSKQGGWGAQDVLCDPFAGGGNILRAARKVLGADVHAFGLEVDGEATCEDTADVVAVTDTFTTPPEWIEQHAEQLVCEHGKDDTKCRSVTFG